MYYRRFRNSRLYVDSTSQIPSTSVGHNMTRLVNGDSEMNTFHTFVLILKSRESVSEGLPVVNRSSQWKRLLQWVWFIFVSRSRPSRHWGVVIESLEPEEGRRGSENIFRSTKRVTLFNLSTFIGKYKEDSSKVNENVWQFNLLCNDFVVSQGFIFYGNFIPYSIIYGQIKSWSV